MRENDNGTTQHFANISSERTGFGYLKLRLLSNPIFILTQSDSLQIPSFPPVFYIPFHFKAMSYWKMFNR